MANPEDMAKGHVLAVGLAAALAVGLLSPVEAAKKKKLMVVGTDADDD